MLRQYFGFPAFRAGQQTLIDAVLSGRDALGVMPTGGGKSLCYELPALLLPGMTLVGSGHGAAERGHPRRVHQQLHESGRAARDVPRRALWRI